MPQKDLLELARRIEAAPVMTADLANAALHALRASFPGEAAAGQVPDTAVYATDAIIALVVAALPGWHFSIHGRARPGVGPWSCTLRRSDVLDDDEILGTGEAPALSQALLVAVLRVAALR